MGQNSVEGVDCFGKIFEKFHQILFFLFVKLVTLPQKKKKPAKKRSTNQAGRLMGVMTLANVHQIFTFCGTLLLSSVTLFYSY